MSYTHPVSWQGRWHDLRSRLKGLLCRFMRVLQRWQRALHRLSGLARAASRDFRPRALAKLILATIEMKGAWPLPLARNQDLMAAMGYPQLAKLLIPVVQQVLSSRLHISSWSFRLTTASLADCMLHCMAHTPQGALLTHFVLVLNPSCVQPSNWWTRMSLPCNEFAPC